MHVSFMTIENDYNAGRCVGSALVFIALEGAVGGAAAVSLLNHGAVDVRRK